MSFFYCGEPDLHTLSKKLDIKLLAGTARLAFLEGFDFGTVTIRASLLGWRIEKDLLSVQVFEEFVASGASDVAMFAFQRESGPLVMVKQ